MQATWKNNTVDYIQWTSNNLQEVREWLGKDHKIFTATDTSQELYVTRVGIVGLKDYLCKSKNYTYSSIQVYPWKVFPRIIQEDISKPNLAE